MRLREPVDAARDEERGEHGAAAEGADEVAGVGVRTPERVGEGGRLGVDRVRGEADRGHDQEEGEQPRLVAHESKAVAQARFASLDARRRGAGCTTSNAERRARDTSRS